MRAAVLIVSLVLACCTRSACPAQEARGDGLCNLILGYRWNGEHCEAVSGCSCTGRDCDSLARTDDPAICEASACGARNDASR